MTGITQFIFRSGSKLNRLFINTNWASLIDFRSYPESNFRGYTQIPAIKFTDGAQQYEAVSSILTVVLSALSDFERSHLTAIEWAINEITDNVLNHAQSPVGGFVQVTNFPKRRMIEFTVCDAGVGVPTTLRQNNNDIPSDHEALDRAIREGVTRDKAFGQGNGLYGTWRICQLSNGKFEIYSCYASLISAEREGMHIRAETIPFNGTLVTARIGYDSPLDLKQALRFQGKSHIPTDFVEVNYEEDDNGNIRFILKEESHGFGSRASGEPVRRKLKNLSKIIRLGRITIDFVDIPLISSSYADEVFGKLFVEMGAIEFSRQFDFRSLDPLVKDLIDRAITQRAMAK